MRPSTFRAIFAGLVIADLIASDGVAYPSAPGLQWQSLLLDVGCYCATGRVPDGASHGARLQQLWSENLAAGLLAAVPVLLLNLEPYGHRQADVAGWARGLGLPDPAIVALDECFVYLCSMHNLHHPLGESLPQLQGKGLRSMPPITTPALATVQHLVQRVQGQFTLGLQVAQRQGWNSAQVGLVALITALGGGLQGLPLDWRRELLTLPQTAAGLAYSEADRRQMLQLSDQLYRLWSGVNSDGTWGQTGGVIVSI